MAANIVGFEAEEVQINVFPYAIVMDGLAIFFAGAGSFFITAIGVPNVTLRLFSAPPSGGRR
jgi:hypothetical protein